VDRLDGRSAQVERKHHHGHRKTAVTQSGGAFRALAAIAL
jgi:hypothetical protein